MNPEFAIPVMWTLVGALAVKLLTAWDRLPDRVAVHFGMALQPNGWSSRSGLAAIVLIAMLGQAALATFVLLRVGSAAGWIAPATLVMVSVVLVAAFRANHQLQRPRNTVSAAVDLRAQDRAVCFHHGVSCETDVRLLPALNRKRFFATKNGS